MKQRKRRILIIVGITLGAYFVYLFFPFGSVQFPEQSQLRTDSDIQTALNTLADDWDISESDIRIFDSRIGTFKEFIAVYPEDFSSAHVWIASTESQDGCPSCGLGLAERIHILAQYRPSGTLEGILAKNFFLKRAKANSTAIANIELGILFGTIRSSSLDIGEVHYPTLLTYPLGISYHLDRF